MASRERGGRFAILIHRPSASDKPRTAASRPRDPLDLRVGGQKATLAKISKNVKKYFDHQNVVRKFDLRHTSHAENYDHFKGFPHIPGLLGLKNQLKNSIFHFCIF